MRHPIVEKYGAYAIDLGIQNTMDTNLNMSAAAALRRAALVAREDADKRFEEFVNPKVDPKKEGELNLSLKVM